MSVASVGISLPDNEFGGYRKLRERLRSLKEEAGAEFVELAPQRLDVLLGNRLDGGRLEEIKGVLSGIEGLSYTVHPPLRLNLMDLGSQRMQRDILEAGVRFAAEIGAGVAVCHAGRRISKRDAPYGLKEQLTAEREALREAGELASEVGVTIAVENWCPESTIIGGEAYTYSLWPSELAEQVGEVDHPAVGICLDVGHAFVASGFCGFDFISECAAAAPLVSHIHLHDNFGRPDIGGEPDISERYAYGLGDLHLPPGRGEIPLEKLFGEVVFPREPTCCVELVPGSQDSVCGQALESARRVVGVAGMESRIEKS